MLSDFENTLIEESTIRAGNRPEKVSLVKIEEGGGHVKLIK